MILSITKLARRSLCCAGLIFVGFTVQATGVYESPDSFLTRVFDGEPPSPKSLWLTGDLKQQVADILQHAPANLRTRYWINQTDSAWILEEIGKTEPITVGISVVDNAIDKINVLTFRESRGWEIRHDFFLEQFDQVKLVDNELDRKIDGISGATLSVRAMKKLARLALLFDATVRDNARGE